MSKLSQNLSILRKEANFSTQELSERTGINEQLIIAFEKDTITPNDEQLMVLCRTLKMPYEDIAIRDLAEERKNATKGMKQSQNRSNYNWYFGNRKWLFFYLGYIAYFVIGVTILVLFYTNYFVQNEITVGAIKEYYYLEYPPYPYFIFFIIIMWNITRFGLIAFGVGSSIFMLIDYFAGKRIGFRWWYLFFISIIITVLTILGVVGSIPYLVYVIYKLIRRKY